MDRFQAYLSALLRVERDVDAQKISFDVANAVGVSLWNLLFKADPPMTVTFHRAAPAPVVRNPQGGLLANMSGGCLVLRTGDAGNAGCR
jgi:hypothetical protein